MYKLVITELAHQDPIAARDFLDEVDKCYGYLKSNPWMYGKCQNKRLEKEGYRRVPIKNYLLVYKIDEETNTVNIMRFFYGAQDYINLI